MARPYTAEEVCAAILNDDLDEMNSADSLDESFSESSSSTSELDSNPEEDYTGRTINVQVPLPTRGRPSASKGKRWNKNKSSHKRWKSKKRKGSENSWSIKQ